MQILPWLLFLARRGSPTLALALVLVAIPPAQTTGSWRRESALPTSVRLKAAAATPDGTLWAVGANGVAVSSADGGATWTTRYLRYPSSGNLPELYDVSFADATHGWIGGNLVLRTSDGGATWQPLSSVSALQSISFVDPTHGFGSPGDWTVSSTTDGGTTWSNAPVPGATSIRDVEFVNRNSGWAVGNAGSSGVIYHTQNGGATWQSQLTVAGRYFLEIVALDADRVWALNGRDVYRSTDGGATWQVAVLPQPFPPQAWWSIAFSSATLGIACGDGGTLARTTDGGASWQLESGTAISSTLFGTAITPSGVGVAVGDWGQIAATPDHGATWTYVSNGAGDILTDLAVVDERIAYACSSQNRFLLKTVDGGDRWDVAVLPSSVFQTAPEDLDFVDADTGWLVATLPTTVARTDDGGDTWSARWTSPGAQMYEVMAFDHDVVVIGGPRATGTPPFLVAPYTLRTVDGGDTWEDITAQFDGRGAGLWYGSFNLDDRTGWLVGDIVARTDDGGASWTIQKAKVQPQIFADVSFADANHGWIVGDFGYVFATTDGGSTWVRQSIGSSDKLTTVSAVSSNVAWIGTANGTALRTDDGGATWRTENPGNLGGGAYTVAFQSEDRGWIVGHPLGGSPNEPGGNVFRRSPGTPLDLVVTPLRSATTAELRVDAALPAEPVYFLLSPDPNPTGACGIAGPTCLDLGAPQFHLGTAIPGADGVARLALPLPAGLPAVSLRFQAAVLRMGRGLLLSNATTRPALQR